MKAQQINIGDLVVYIPKYLIVVEEKSFGIVTQILEERYKIMWFEEGYNTHSYHKEWVSEHIVPYSI